MSEVDLIVYCVMCPPLVAAVAHLAYSIAALLGVGRALRRIGRAAPDLLALPWPTLSDLP